ncbi:MAG TPA: hypothetical protein VMU32_06395 [Solirubrobacteraceae bacterium]|nr:hypothetical protein [Solirubrobacteraceae bacterium]
MPALPLRDEYRPTLPELLGPHWRRLSRARRLPVLFAGTLLLAILLGAVLTLLPPTYSHAGTVSFSFGYRGLYRAPTPPGAYVRVQHVQDGRLRDSFEVSPLLLAPYRGEPTPALALYATGYIRALAAREPGFALRGEGWTQVDSISPYAVYNVFYTVPRDGRELYGRNILVLPQRPGARRGVTISMLGDPGGEKQLSSPLLLGTVGALEGPLVSFDLR